MTDNAPLVITDFLAVCVHLMVAAVHTVIVIFALNLVYKKIFPSYRPYNLVQHDSNRNDIRNEFAVIPIHYIFQKSANNLLGFTHVVMKHLPASWWIKNVEEILRTIIPHTKRGSALEILHTSHSTKVGKFLSLTKLFVYLSSSSGTLPLVVWFD